MKTEANKSVIQLAGQAIYEADPTLKPFDDLSEEEKTGYYLQAKAALRCFLKSLHDLVG